MRSSLFLSLLLKTLILAILSILILSCSSNKKNDGFGSNGSTGEPNSKKTVYSLKQPMKNMLGTWHGFMYCTNINYLFDMDVKKSANGAITAQFNSKLYFYKSGDRVSGSVYPSELALNLQGKFFPDQSMFFLRSQSTDQKQRMTLKGVLDPGSPRFTAEVSMPYYGQCSMVLAGKDDIEDTLSDIHEASEFETNLFYHPSGSNKCDGAMKQWVAKVKPITIFDSRNKKISGQYRYTALEIFQDKHFEPFFKEGFTELSETEVGAFYRKLVNGCSTSFPRKQSSQKVLTSVYQLIQNQKEFPRSELLMYPHIKQILSNWKRAAIKQFDTITPSKAQQLSALADSVLMPLWPSESGSIKEELILADRRKASKKMLADLKLELAKRPITFIMLAKLASFVEDYTAAHNANTQNISRQRIAHGNQTKNTFTLSPESTNEANKLIKDTLDKNVISAANKLAPTINTPDGILNFLTPIGQGQYKALYKHLDKNKRNQVNEIFSSKKHNLLTELANKESKNYAAISSTGSGVSLIHSLNSYETQLENNYQYLLGDKEFASFNKKRNHHRTEALSNNQTTIEKNFASTNTLPQLEKAYKDLLLDTDKGTVTGIQITAYYQQQRLRISPFFDYPGGKYLDAIYKGDFSSIRSQDNQYGKSIAENFDQAMQGLAPGSKNPYSLKSSANKITLIKPLSATYLFRYQNLPKKCLKPDHVEFKVTKNVPGSVTTNLLGWEVSRTYGYSTSTSYLINKEFEELFRIVGNSSPNSFSSGFTDNLLGGGLMREVIQGTKAIMQDFDCNSEVIKQFERNMRTYALRRLQ